MSLKLSDRTKGLIAAAACAVFDKVLHWARWLAEWAADKIYGDDAFKWLRDLVSPLSQHEWLGFAMDWGTRLCLFGAAIYFFIRAGRSTKPPRTGINLRSLDGSRSPLDSLVTIDISDVGFEPNLETEFYMSFVITNPSYPTILSGWILTAYRNGQICLSIPPRIMFPPLWNITQGRLIEGEDLTQKPLESGARRELRFIFTTPGNARSMLGRPGTLLSLSATDVRGKNVVGEYNII